MNLTTYKPTTSLEFLDSSGSTVDTVAAVITQITSASRVSSIKEQLGLDKASLVLEARLTSPTTLPATVKAGMRAALTWAGRGGAARLEPYQYNLTSAWKTKYGEKILLSWQTDEIT